MQLNRKTIAAVLIGILSPWVNASDSGRIALVLGGGGARGAAHIGVLEVLERERIPVDCVVGTSMGGLVAGSYAAGLSPQTMRDKLAVADWTDMFLDVADFSQLSYRKKKVSKRYLAGTELGLTKNGVQIQPGVVAGEKIKLFFNQLVDADLGEREIQELSLPLAIVATDIGTGERVVFRSGSLTQAMRASMSVPGLMAPVEYENRKLVDGGLVDNLPIEVARDLCKADRVIAVNVGSPLKPPESIGSLLSVTAQMIGILTKQNVERSLASLTGRDIYIAPELGDIKATDFARYEEAADIGRAAAQRQVLTLRELSVDQKTYAAWQLKNKDGRKKEIYIDQVVISPLRRVHPQYVARQIQQQEGQLLNRAQLEQDLVRAYGDGFYDGVDYRIVAQEGKNILEITAAEKAWSSDYLTFGFSIDNEYRKGSNFNLRSAYRNTWMNDYGGEFFAAIDVGTESALELDFYQPVDYRHHFFIEPRYFKEREIIGLFADDMEIAEYQLDTSYSELLLGTNLGVYGQSSIGWREYRIKGTADISAVTLPDVDERYGGVEFSLNLDRRNRIYFPSHGWRSEITFFDAHHEGYKKLSVDVGQAYKLNDFVFAVRGLYVASLEDELPFYDAVMLGGFLNLSGYASNQIIGDDAFYSHLRAERIIGRMPLGLNGDLRMGFALEAAKLQTIYTMTQTDRWLDSGVLYLGGETPLGPLYLGYGFTFSGDYNLYFKLGAF
ncbi:patatin-like phospholipase family protein [Cellvibrio sp. OA-2007]|uniref:patatin-like phospholipase family protein n=1 Tax=Cellvibrio sp. OA-2007 TaxID=529823 RepID=UPI000A009724|nr:patatin-like phospholipase family protein [Cellvibrio sp. OA-2007]